jgi:5'-3' exonuclease
VDGRRNKVRDAAAVREKFGVDPDLIPDYLALVGDSADGYPGVPGIGAVGAARLINRYGTIDNFPAEVLGGNRDAALIFRTLATLRTDAPLFQNVDELRWDGPTGSFAAIAEQMGDARIVAKCRDVAARIAHRR